MNVKMRQINRDGYQWPIETNLRYNNLIAHLG